MLVHPEDEGAAATKFKSVAHNGWRCNHALDAKSASSVWSRVCLVGALLAFLVTGNYQ